MRNRLSLVCLLVVLVFGVSLVAGAVPRDEKKPVNDHGVKALPIKASPVGEWFGLAETRNDRVSPESLKIKFFINADASVTGFVGTWKLADAVIRRTTAKERQDLMAEFVISGQAEGMKAPNGGNTLVKIAADFKGLAAEGTVRGYAEQKNDSKIVWHRWNIIRLNMYPLK